MTYSNKVNKKQQDYLCFSKIDGRHPFKNAAPNGFVDYSIIGVSEKMVRSRKSVNSKGLHDMFVEFVEEQILCPEYFERSGRSHKRLRNKKTKKILNTMLRIVKDYREGI